MFIAKSKKRQGRVALTFFAFYKCLLIMLHCGGRDNHPHL